MDQVEFSDFQQDLQEYFKRAQKEAYKVTIVDGNSLDQIVIMSACEYNSLLELLNIYKSPELQDDLPMK